MFARIKKSGRNEYLQLVENRRDGEKISQRVVATIGRMDKLRASGNIETIIRSLSRFSEKVWSCGNGLNYKWKKQKKNNGKIVRKTKGVKNVIPEY